MSPYLSVPRPNPEARLRLFCFPFAGGNAALFRGWPALLPANVEVAAVQLPGRATRFREPPFQRMEPLVEALCEALLPALDRPFAFFGHSMGALVAFELTRRLRQLASARVQPALLFVSGRGAPQLPSRIPALHALPEPQFSAELRRLEGTPAAILDHAEMMALLTPMLRADFAVCETYVYRHEPRLTCPVSAFGGLDDATVPAEDLDAWREQTDAGFRLRQLPGKHFFVTSAAEQLLRALADDLEQV